MSGFKVCGIFKSVFVLSSFKHMPKVNTSSRSLLCFSITNLASLSLSSLYHHLKSQSQKAGVNRNHPAPWDNTQGASCFDLSNLAVPPDCP